MDAPASKGGHGRHGVIGKSCTVYCQMTRKVGGSDVERWTSDVDENATLEGLQSEMSAVAFPLDGEQAKCEKAEMQKCKNASKNAKNATKTKYTPMLPLRTDWCITASPRALHLSM